MAATALFVVISQLKINVTNAYAGSLAWSNFFSRVTHSHPGRVVWVVFNALIAFMLMEMNVFEALGDVLGLYANIAIAWMMAVVADLVINKPLGLSPPGIEFKRAHLWDINPVGVGAMALASALSITRAPGRVRAAGAGLLGADRAGHGVRRRAADRLGHARQLLPRARSTTHAARAAPRRRGPQRVRWARRRAPRPAGYRTPRRRSAA